MSLGWPEILLIVLVVLLLFGATRLPKLARSMGQSVNGFKQGLHEDAPPDDDGRPSTPETAKKDDPHES